MRNMPPKWIIAGAVLFTVVFFVSGAGMLYLSVVHEKAWPLLKEWDTPIISTHVICWMWLGIFANYFWDLYRIQGSMHQPNYDALIAPLLVSPMVLFGFYSMIDPTKIAFSINLIAFQNGFFWQTIFAKVGPVLTTPQPQAVSPQAVPPPTPP
jgi:hypothetical protein